MTNKEKKKRKGPLDRGLKKSISNGFLGKLFCISRNNSAVKKGEEGSKTNTRDLTPIANPPVRKSTATSFFSCTSPKPQSVSKEKQVHTQSNVSEEPQVTRQNSKINGGIQEVKFETIDELQEIIRLDQLKLK